MSVPFRHWFGALHERGFRLLFAETSITTIGDRLAGIALAFAVLDIGSATAPGLVLAARQGMEALVVVGGGVLSDRLPRNLVLVGASLVQGTAQAPPSWRASACRSTSRSGSRSFSARSRSVSSPVSRRTTRSARSS